ncbi:uncharacterized protein LDX57_001843 [Aspergillus melleus]|uniref:uncharacterized protein n=1 Tax=Aspergillus melleus TaxID=138277 RepID=UPI001E8E4422|nr:uncharacterized protein LDX57_001843 [Aspergillus melleus]KAH8424086.1 hypothetical protein LDX57_001843 [Aspergillus melleus]
MLRLGPTRIFLGEEDLRYHLGRVYLRQTESAAGFNTDQTDSDYEDGDEDEYEDEDDKTSVGSQDFSPYALSHFKASSSDSTSEPDGWPQGRWPRNWRTNAVCLSSTFADSTTLGTSLSSRIELASSRKITTRLLYWLTSTFTKHKHTNSHQLEV